MSYLGSHIAAPVSHPQGLTLWPDLTLFSSMESKPSWRGLNPGPTELKDVALPTVPRDLVGKQCQLENVYISYLCNSGIVLVLLTLQASLFSLQHYVICAY